MLLVIWSVLIVVAALQSLEFVVAYHMQTRGAWRRDEHGRFQMVSMATFAVVLSLSATNVVIHWSGHEQPPWFPWLQVVVFGAVPVVFAWLRWLLAKAQRPQPV